jgi:uncharacterized protein (TIRG00374 family)
MTVPQMAEPHRGKLRPAILLAVKVAVSLGLMAWLLRRIGVESLLATMGGASPSRLLAAASLLAVSHLLGSWQWGRLLRTAGVDLAWGRVVTYYFAGAFGNLVLPTGAGGDLARVLGTAREGGQGSAAAAATLVDRVLGLGVLGGIGLISLFGAQELATSSTGRYVLMAAAVNAGLSIGGLAIVMSPASRLVLRTIARPLPVRIGGRIDRVEAALTRLRMARGRGLLFLVAVAVQVIRILAHAQIARALDIELGLRYFFLFVPLLAVAVAVPVSIGGIGVRESMGAVLFGLLGVGAAAASAMQLLAYLVAVAVSSPGAAILLARAGGRGRSPRAPGADRGPEVESGAASVGSKDRARTGSLQDDRK